ncbi:hypothetical protein DOS84_04765 [Flavobacterium aquariorum]|uniref:Uncharacterized protein n=1 Tax=Flavobacterium aquariorum TaxID=2217670 RepID=A0A2W7UI53_9FLAO|nr:hypothetical protein [Flavobacterium aquariorum]PZX94867.1 hypothetical protein DOS84_04765 [Flavobacterium aquariorum]
MKTNALITWKTTLYSLIGFLSLVVTSCGSYQNSSYYDNDGVYSTNGEKIVIKDNQPNSASIQYKQYFSSLQSTGGSGEIFTDVNSYGNNYDMENDSIQAPSTGYASWGSSPQETTVVVYPDSYWSIGFGWGYPYYGYGYPYYGWGYPYYGWGYPGYGWGYPGYGCGYPGYGYGYAHVTPYAYNYSRRGSSYGGSYNNSIYNRNRVSAYNRNGVTSRNSTYNRNSTSISRQAPTFTNRNSNTSSRNYTQNQSRSSYTQSRSNTSSNYQRSSYTPSNSSSNSSYRSSGGSMSSGGGARMSSGGGGGRMGGGGRR